MNDKLVRLLFFLGAIRDAGADRVTAVVPYLCYSRKDRKTKSRDPVTTRYLAQMFESAGTQMIVTMDVHNLQAYQNSFRCHTDHLEAKNLFVEYFAPVAKEQDVIIMSPDFGGVYRAEQFRQALNKKCGKNIPISFMEKQRSNEIVTGEAISGNMTDKTVIIIDDLISSGGTLARAAKGCRLKGASKVYAAATHGVFSAKANEALQENSLDEIVVTDTIPLKNLSPELIQRKIKLLPTAPLFAEAIKRMHSGGSIEELLGNE